jgi:hypothetical protein
MRNPKDPTTLMDIKEFSDKQDSEKEFSVERAGTVRLSLFF